MMWLESVCGCHSASRIQSFSNFDKAQCSHQRGEYGGESEEVRHTLITGLIIRLLY